MVMVHGVCRAKSTAVGFYKLVSDDVDLKEVWGEEELMRMKIRESGMPERDIWKGASK
jgi:hypothetical protein